MIGSPIKPTEIIKQTNNDVCESSISVYVCRINEKAGRPIIRCKVGCGYYLKEEVKIDY